MKSKKKAAVVCCLLVVAGVAFVPATRDELDWYWAESENEAPDYMRYLTDWPNGRHEAEARERYEQRTWKDKNRALIAEAVKKNNAPKADANAGHLRHEKLEKFFWGQVTTENTVASYQGYLQRYPNGIFAAQARQRLDDLARQSSSAAPASQ